ncbi:MAG: LysR family transcriptional regulator [Oscillospiraceae bacterium]|nr:LysR family transcriptional regulator [Oscillospiraceae bacterium]
MTLLQMRYILEIERCGSLNKAARRLFVTQSALSSALAEVEKELSIQIFRRSNRGISLTEEGRYLVSQIAPIVSSSSKLDRYYAQRRSPDRAELSVASQRYPFCAKAFVALLQELGEGPKQLSLKELDMAEVIREVAGGQSDLGVIFLSEATDAPVRRALQEQDLVFETLVTLRPHVFLRAGHPLAGAASLRLDQLRPYPNVVFAQADSDPSFAEEAVTGLCGDLDRVIRVSDRATIYNVMAHTDCISTGSGILPAGYCDERLVSIPLEDAHDMILGTIRHRGRPVSDLERRFVEILRETAGEPQG